MSVEKVTGKSVELMFGTMFVGARKAGLSITDNTVVTTDRGLPNGYIRGSVSAEGEIELSPMYFNMVVAMGIANGFQKLPLFDLKFVATGFTDYMFYEAFGCKLMINKVLEYDTNADEEITHTLKYIVTDKKFVKLNGTDYSKDNSLF